MCFIFIAASHLSPRQSAAAAAAGFKNSRKRALSRSSLFSDMGLDIESLTRSSEGSLLLQLARLSRESGLSGSYGHLSAGE